MDFVAELLKEVVECKQAGEKINQKVLEISDRLKSPTNIAFNERPNKTAILEKHSKLKRFKK